MGTLVASAAMNPLFTTAMFFLNFGAIYVLWRFLFMNIVSLAPPSSARDGLMALVS